MIVVMLRNTMRTPFLAALLGLSLVSCTTGEISGGGGDDDNPGGPTCGNGVVDPGEACDGSAGCAADCTLLPIPRVDVSVDKPTLMTELASTSMLTVTVKASGGFSGAVNLTAQALDAANAPLPGWEVTLDSQTVNLTDSQATVIATVKVPSENKGLAATIKITGQSSATEGTNTATTAVTALNQVSLAVTMNNGQCVYPGTGGTANAVKLTTGTKVRFVNKGTAGLIIHSNGGSYGVPHGDVNNPIPVDGTYERTVTGADGQAFSWYCHAPGPDLGGNNPNILVTP